MLRDLQKEKLNKLLSPPQNSFWQILILDSHTKDIISPLLSLNELQKLGITSYFLINNIRQKIEGIPAVYFIEPTEENINFIKQDVIKGLYHGYNLRFTTQISRNLLEDIAFTLSQKKLALHIQSVFDGHIDFIALQNHLFITNQKNSFVEEKNVTGNIFSMFHIFNQIPFLLSKNNTEISKTLNILAKKFKNCKLIDKKHKRPLFVFLDRKFDVFSPLEHVWSYNALIKDLLDFDLNKVLIENKAYILDPNDPFFIQNQSEYFPVVAERIEKEVLEHKKEMALRNIDDRTSKKQTEEILQKLPELQRKNDSMQAHMAICLELVRLIKERSIDDFYRLEKSKYKNSEIIEISEKENINDTLRLCASLKDKDVADAIIAKRKINDDIIKFIRSFSDKTEHEVKALYSQVVSNLLGGIKKLLPVNVESPIFTEVENILNNIKSADFDGLCFVDPNGSDIVYENEISSIVVFVNGGGTYNEYNSLMHLSKKINLPIYFGCTEMLNAEEFMRQINEINK